MIINVPITKILFLDIETVGIFPDYDSCVIDEPILAKQFINYFDWFKKRFPEDHMELSDDVSDSVEVLNTIFAKRSALVPEFAKIVCVTVAFVLESGEIKKQSFYDHNERKLLLEVRNVLDRCAKLDFHLCGHNLKNFDIPVLAKRMIINGISPSIMLPTYNTKPWEIKAIDTKEVWQYGAYSSIGSLDLLCSALRIQSPKDGEVVGSSVHNDYWFNNKLTEIVEYCEKDVIVLVEIIKYLKNLE